LKQPYTAKFIRITWPFAVIMVLMLGLSAGCMQILSAARAYVGGEGLWSKGQKDATAHLLRYARSLRAQDYERFRSALAIPLGDRTARLALQRKDAHTATADAAAHAGFLAGRNHPDDIANLIWLFRNFGELPFMRKAIAVWTQGDALIDELAVLGERLHAEIAGGRADPFAIAALAAEVERVDRALGPLEDEFSATLGEASRTVASLLLWTLAGSSVVFLGLGGLVSHSMLRQTEKIEAALRATEAQVRVEQERAHVTLASIRDGVVSTDARGRVDYLNAAAVQMTGWTLSEAVGQPLPVVLRLVDANGVEPMPGVLQHLLRGGSPAASRREAQLVRRDGTRLALHESLAPIHGAHGEVLGVVAALRDVSQERAMAAQLRHQATHDGLTGLVNRTEFEARLAAALTARTGGAPAGVVLYLDLDQFKVVNDTCGHPAGDELIRQVASAVQASLRSSDTLARLGGDEFGVLLADCSLAAALGLAERIRACIEKLRFVWRERTFVIGVSIGAVAVDESFDSVAAVMSAADSACYLAKDGGRNRVRVYEPDDHQLRTRSGEMEWVARIAGALEESRFELYAQEMRPLAGGRSHYEILLRLVDESGTLVPPMAFIPAAERYGMMGRIDRWLIARALADIGACLREGGAVATFGINLSGSSVADPGLLDCIAERLRAERIPPERICFELTETAAVTNLVAAARLMSDLKALGCHLALDDFGSGMCSFAYMRNLPFDFLKIDGSLIKHIQTDAINRAMVAAIHNVGRVMGAQTIAEWVEDDGVLHAVAAIGIDYAQGYGIHRPVPLAEVLRQFAAQPVRALRAA
jgi:diguanylate cyclase (GGDEF)-like protein/PAS domain S-box-containing protein